MNDILCIHHDPNNILNKLKGYVPLKPGLVGSPSKYLGTKLKHIQLHNGIWACLIRPSKYVQEAVRMCEENIVKQLSKGQRKQTIHSKVAIALTWMCPWY